MILLKIKHEGAYDYSSYHTDMRVCEAINKIETCTANRINPVKAIKEIKNKYSFDLKQAKDIVDCVLENLNADS